MNRRWTGASVASREVRRQSRPVSAVRLAPAAITASILTLVSGLTGGAQELTLPRALARATEYVEELHAQLSGVVMEERYRQRASSPGFGFGNDSYERVTLRSDYLLVRPEGSERYFGFRDVFEANGSRVRDREERLTQLFLDGRSTVDRRVQGILTDSARYNVGDIQRNTNTPTLALLFLRQSYKPRFEFERVRDRSPSLGIEEPDGDDIWVIAYRETWPTTVIRRRRGGNLAAEGRYWIDPRTGGVLVTELVLEDEGLESLVTVRYERPEELEHLVPVEMRERYNNRRSGSRVEGTATYSRFRRFQVLVEESAPFRD
ncbi:MAG: hypothetical protein OXG04_09815 [Acidobacteria bacterium]|nr:hypothetical protein [Acidobacteriota bacterium]